MPVDRANNRFSCNYPDCSKTFGRPYDLQRHKNVHCVYEERQFACPFAGCRFRANQQGGLKCHVNSIHENLRLPCGEPGCVKSFSDPSSRSKHRQKFHSTTDEASGSSQSGRDHKIKHPAAYPVSIHAWVAWNVEEHSQQDVKLAVHINPPSDDGPSNLDARRPASSGPSTSVYRPNCTIRPSPREHPGVFHRANDVPADSWSVDNHNQLKHQAYDANPWAAPTASSYHPDAPVPSRPHMPTTNQPSQSGSMQRAQTRHDQSCRCWDCVIRASLTLAPLQGRQEEDRAQGEGCLPNPFSYAGTRHVPPSDHQWVHPPIPNDIPSTVYARPNPRMLFDLR